MMDIKSAVIEILKSGFCYKQAEIKKILLEKYNVRINERSLRDVYLDIRNDFANGLVNYSICSSNKGNFISYDLDVIAADSEKDRKTAYAILKSTYARDKRISHNNQLSFIDYMELLEREG